MKTIISILILWIATTSIFAIPAKKKHNIKRTQIEKLSSKSETVFVSEDFSKFTAGSEAEPDATQLASDERNQLLDLEEIPSEYTKTPGWYGWNIYQAGGSCYITFDVDDEEDFGYIATPEMDLSSLESTYTVKFKARTQTETTSEIYIYRNWYDTDEEGWDYDEGNIITISNEWEEYTLSLELLETPEFNEALYIDFWPRHEIFIDDIEIVNSTDAAIKQPAVNKAQFTVINGKLIVEHLNEGEVIEIYNISGQQVYKQVYIGEDINLNNLNSGLYIVRSGSISEKIVK